MSTKPLERGFMTEVQLQGAASKPRATLILIRKDKESELSLPEQVQVCVQELVDKKIVPDEDLKKWLQDFNPSDDDPYLDMGELLVKILFPMVGGLTHLQQQALESYIEKISDLLEKILPKGEPLEAFLESFTTFHTELETGALEHMMQTTSISYHQRQTHYSQAAEGFQGRTVEQVNSFQAKASAQQDLQLGTAQKMQTRVGKVEDRFNQANSSTIDLVSATLKIDSARAKAKQEHQDLAKLAKDKL